MPASKAVRCTRCFVTTCSCAACAPAPHRAHAIERGDTQRRGKVSVRSATRRRLFERPPHLLRESFRFAKQLGRSGLALHRRAVDSTRHRQLARSVRGAQRTKHALNRSSIAGSCNPHIDLRNTLCGDDIGARSAGDDTGVDRETFAEIRECRDLLYEPRHLQNSRVAALKVHTGVRRDALHTQREVADAFARCLVRQPLRGLHHKHGGARARDALRDGPRDGAADLFVTVEQQGDRRQRDVKLLQTPLAPRGP